MVAYTKKLTLTILFSIILALFSGADAQNNEEGGVESLFTAAGIGARALSLGGAFVAVSDDPTAVYWNPAGLDYIQKKGASFFYSSLGFGSSYNFIGGAWPTLNFGTIGLGWARLATDEIQEFDASANPVGPPGDYGADLFFFSYAKQIRKTLSLGGSFKLERQNFAFANLSDSGVGLDLGLLYKPELSGVFENLAFGFNIQNAIASQLRFREADESTPVNFKAGLAKIFVLGDERNQLRFAFDLNKGEGSGTMHFGTEYSFQNSATMRVGMNGGQVALGAGARYHNLEIDYNFGRYFDGEAFSANHRFSLTIHLGKSKDQRRLEIAQARQREIRIQVQDSLWINSELEFSNNMQSGRESYYENDYTAAFTAFARAKDAAKTMENIAMRLRGVNGEDREAEGRIQTAFTAIEEADQWFEKANTKVDSVQQAEIQRVYLEAAIQERQSARKAAIDSLNTFVSKHRRTGTRFFKEGDFQRAINEWRLVVASIENFEDPPEEIKRMKLQVESDIGTAEKQVQAQEQRQRSKLQQLTFDEHFNQGMRYYASKDWENAVKSFQRALEINPKHREAKEKLEAAKARSVATVQQMPPVVRAKFVRARSYYNEKRYNEALELLETIRQEQPYNKMILDMIDRVFEKMNK